MGNLVHCGLGRAVEGNTIDCGESKCRCLVLVPSFNDARNKLCITAFS